MKILFLFFLMVSNVLSGTLTYTVIAALHYGIQKKETEYTLIERTSVNRYTKALAYQLYVVRAINYEIHNTLPFPIIIAEPKIKSLP